MPKKHWYAAGYNFLGQFAAEELKTVERFSSVYNWREGELLELPGGLGRDVLLIQKGGVRISRSDQAGKSLALAELKEGAVFGELPVRIDTTGFTLAAAAGETAVVHLKEEGFRLLLEKKPNLELKAKAGFFPFRRTYRTRFADWLYLDGTAKTARFLLEQLKKGAQRHPRGQMLLFPAAPALIAALTADTEVSVLLAFGSFYKQKLLQLDGKRLVICDAVGLRYLAQ